MSPSLKLKVSLAWLGPGSLVRHAAVVADGGSVTYAGPSAGAPAADEVLELDGFLMPGVADRHVHDDLIYVAASGRGARDLLMRSDPTPGPDPGAIVRDLWMKARS